MEVSLRDIKLEQLLCMRGAMGHEWDMIQKPRRYEQWGYRVHARCVRCHKERTTIFDYYGNNAAQMYDDTNAIHEKITVPYTTADVRREVARRFMKGAA